MVCIAEQSLSNLTFMNSSVLGFTWGTVWKVGGERKRRVCISCVGGRQAHFKASHCHICVKAASVVSNAGTSLIFFRVANSRLGKFMEILGWSPVRAGFGWRNLSKGNVPACIHATHE